MSLQDVVGLLASPESAGDTMTSQSDIKMINELQKYHFYGPSRESLQGLREAVGTLFFLLLLFCLGGKDIQPERKLSKR